jgi:hypothetical protein
MYAAKWEFIGHGIHQKSLTTLALKKSRKKRLWT